MHRALAAAFLLVALVAIPATAHAQLDKPTPADKATVTQPVTVVSGTFVERVNPNGSSLVVKLVGGGTVATGGVDPSNAKQMLATPGDAARLRLVPGPMDDGLARRRRAGARDVDVHRRGRAIGCRHTGREPDTGSERDRRADGRRDGRRIGRRAVDRSDTPAVGRRRHDGERQRRRGPDHRGAHRARRRCGLSPQSTQPPDQPDATDHDPDAPTPPTTPT